MQKPKVQTERWLAEVTDVLEAKYLDLLPHPYPDAIVEKLYLPRDAAHSRTGVL